MTVELRGLLCASVALSTLCAAAPTHAAVTISTDATANMSCVSGVCTPTAADAVLNVGDLTTMLASGNVTVNTGTGSLPAQVEDILVTASFNWASANSLTLDAYRSVTVSAPIAVNGAAPVALLTDDGGSGGFLSFGVGGSLSFLGTTNSLSIHGKTYNLENTIAALAAAIAHKPSGHYALSASYDAGHDKTYRQSPIPKKFSGTFEGLGNTISNLTISAKVDNARIGLFSTVETGGTVSDLVVENLKLTVRGFLDYEGGIVAFNAGNLAGGFVQGTINGRHNSAGQTGGVTGASSGTITRSSSAVDITGDTDANVGGETGYSSGVISLSSASGNVTGISFVGGGLVGTNTGSVEESFSSMAVTGGQYNYFGGLIGDDRGVTSNSYATGNVTGLEKALVGGLDGEAFGGFTLSTSYSTGAVSAGSGGTVGGFVGVDDDTLSDCDWDTTTSGTDNGTGKGNVAGLTGLTTQQLQSGLPAGFDPTIWAESRSINNGLPYLIANPPQ